MSDRKYHLVTFGCQMNKSDSERMATLLERVGYAPSSSPEEADLILINTCSVRQTAEDRVFGKVNDFAKLKARNPRLLIGVTGCMAGRDRDGKLRKKLPAVDLFFPTRDLPQLPRWLAEHDPELVNVGDAVEEYLKLSPKAAREHSSYVTIQTGCNKFCTYCVVPHARGLEQNRPVADILGEVRERAGRGTLEIVLLGQTVNAYRAPDPETFSKENPYRDDFAALLWEINQVPGIERLHYTAPHPLHMTDEVIDALTLPKHVEYLHLPVQAGDDEVLRRMNRRYTHAFYVDLIGRIRTKRPDIAIGTDIIVGFCGETEAQFERTVELYRACDFDISYTAMYSPRTGTVAHEVWKDDVPKAEKKRRWNVLQALMEEISLRKNRAQIGRTAEVLVDNCREQKTMGASGERVRVLTCGGTARNMKAVTFSGTPDLVGRLVPVRIVGADTWVLKSETA
jgi:tRNA-2-methylthio-N6-dimethylallyladenosine synthase